MDLIEQKAKDIMDKFRTYVVMWTGGTEVENENVRQCAIICVEEIIEALDEISLAESGTTMMDYGQSHFKKVKERLLTQQQ